LAQVLEPLRYKNLDDAPEFKGIFTTTEFLSGHIFREMAAKVRAGALNDNGRVNALAHHAA
jgi:hypothetical protein